MNMADVNDPMVYAELDKLVSDACALMPLSTGEEKLKYFSILNRINIFASSALSRPIYLHSAQIDMAIRKLTRNGDKVHNFAEITWEANGR